MRAVHSSFEGGTTVEVSRSQAVAPEWGDFFLRSLMIASTADDHERRVKAHLAKANCCEWLARVTVDPGYRKYLRELASLWRQAANEEA